MTILRIVNDRPHEFTLTKQEMCDALREIQLIWDTEDIFRELRCYIETEDHSERCQKILENLQNCPSFLEKVAYRYRETISDIGFDECIDSIVEAYNYVAGFIEEEG